MICKGNIIIRDWSLITGRGVQNGRGERVLPLRKGEAEIVLAMLEGGHNKFRDSFNTGA